MEVLLNDEIPAREVIQPALRYNPDFFNPVYTDLINCEKKDAVIQNTLEAINAYLDERLFIFQPILDYLIEQKAPRTNTELSADLGRSSHGESDGDPEFDEESLDLVCQWLAWKGVIRQVAMPMKLTAKSQVPLEEPAYYYDGTAVEQGQAYLQEDIHAQIHRAVDNLTDTLKEDMYILGGNSHQQSRRRQRLGENDTLHYANLEGWDKIQAEGVPVNRRWYSVPGSTPYA